MLRLASVSGGSVQAPARGSKYSLTPLSVEPVSGRRQLHTVKYTVKYSYLVTATDHTVYLQLHPSCCLTVSKQLSYCLVESVQPSLVHQFLQFICTVISFCNVSATTMATVSWLLKLRDNISSRKRKSDALSKYSKVVEVAAQVGVQAKALSRKATLKVILASIAQLVEELLLLCRMIRRSYLCSLHSYP
jgi:hypothetical protein